MEINIKQKISKKYLCEICNYITSRKSNMDSHLNSAKHKMEINGNKNQQILSNIHCETCNKKYQTIAGLWKHKSKGKCNTKCSNDKNIYNSENISDKITVDGAQIDKDQLIISLIKQNYELLKETCDFKSIMMEQQNMMMKVLENGTNNTTHINSHNKAFNLNFFLNETCKDAMNIMDFVDSIKLQVTDLERVGEVGYVEGISDIIVSNLNKLDITQRPIHCTDKKRETMYVKDAGKWEKDESTTVIRRAIRKVTHNNQRLLPQFKEKYPDYHNSYSSHSDKVTKVIIETMVNNVPDKEEKIIKNIAKSVVLDKNVI